MSSDDKLAILSPAIRKAKPISLAGAMFGTTFCILYFELGAFVPALILALVITPIKCLVLMVHSKVWKTIDLREKKNDGVTAIVAVTLQRRQPQPRSRKGKRVNHPNRVDVVP